MLPLLLRPRLLLTLLIGGALVATAVGIPVVDTIVGLIPTDWTTWYDGLL